MSRPFTPGEHACLTVVLIVTIPIALPYTLLSIAYEEVDRWLFYRKVEAKNRKLR